MRKGVSGGTVHRLPTDLKKALAGDAAVLAAWESLTPLARNEWICWIESVRKAATRQGHVERACADLKAGKRRPCCWMGCTHRKDKSLSPSQEYLMARRAPGAKHRRR
jgi:hypothetical protein